MGASSSSSAGAHTNTTSFNLNVKSTTLRTTTRTTSASDTSSSDTSWIFSTISIPTASTISFSFAFTNDGSDTTTLSDSTVSEYEDLLSSLQTTSGSSPSSTVNLVTVQTTGGAYITGTEQLASAATSEAQSYTLTTQNGGVCLMSNTETSPAATQDYATYVPATTLGYANRFRARASASMVSTAAGAAAGSAASPSYVAGDGELPISDIPLCPTAVAMSVATVTAAPAAGQSSSSFSNQDQGTGGLSAAQRGGVAAGVIAAIVILLVAAIWWLRRLGAQRQLTNAQRNMWAWGPGAAGPAGTVGGRNADVTEAGPLVSGLGLRQVLYGPRGARPISGDY